MSDIDVRVKPRAASAIVAKRSNRTQLVMSAVGLVGLAVAPLYLDATWLNMGILVMVSGIGAIALTILVGVAGQLSLAHAFFLAVGAYGYAYLSGEPGGTGASGLGLPPLLGAVAAVALSALAGLLFSPVAARLRGLYLGVASLALVFIGQHVLHNATSVTGGSVGRKVPTLELFGFQLNGSTPAIDLMGVPLGPRERMWYLAAVMLVVVFVCTSRIVRGRPGRALHLLKGNESAAGAMGVDAQRYRAGAFVLTSALAGLAGVLTALAYGTVVPQHFGFTLSVSFLVMIVIGGLGSVGGAILGAAIVTALPLLLQRFGNELGFLAPAGSGGYDATLVSQIAFGVAIVLVIIFRPGGLISVGQAWRRGRIARSVRRDLPTPNELPKTPKEQL